jgi:hypothetical protein
VQVPAYTDEPAALVNRADPPTYDPMKVALANHSFPWGRPFTNRNGRVVRLLTYALPIKYGFRAGQGGQAGRLLNPAAVFCTDRQRYCDRLAQADAGPTPAQERDPQAGRAACGRARHDRQAPRQLPAWPRTGPSGLHSRGFGARLMG